MKKFLVFMIIAASIGISYFYSGDVYRYYLNYYYFKIKKETKQSLYKKATDLYKEEKHEELKKYLYKLETLYPDDYELKKTGALNYLKLGEKTKASEMILEIQDKVGIPHEMIEPLVATLYEKGFYTDIMEIMQHRVSDNPNVLYHYGVSLYHSGKNERAYSAFTLAERNGRTDYLCYYYMGLILERKREYKGALRHLLHAWELKYRDNDVGRALARVYRAQGNFEKAAKILQVQKRY